MDEKLITLWTNMLDVMKTKFDVNAYSTFFLPLVPKEIDNKTIIIEAPTRFVKEVVSSEMFISKINETLKEITNEDYIIEVKEKQENNEVKVEKEEVKIVDNNLNKAFDFTNFVVGPCNKECYEASLSVAINPGSFYNPLFIYGRAGIGKTHLLHAIGNYCAKNQSKPMNIYYTTANDFVDEFMKSSQNKDIDSMKAKFRSIDMLLLDDIQFLAGKDKTGEVFFHIFNTLFNEKKQIVLTSDRNPNDLKGLEARLVSRFASGLTVGMNAPEYDTARAILKRKIDSKNFGIKNIDDDVIDFIAQNYSSDVRQLEGALTRLFFFVTTINRCDEITLDIAMEALKNITPPKKNKSNISVNDIKKAICDYYSLSNEQLIGNSRVSNIVIARSLAMYLCRLLLKMKFEDIGREFNRDHSSIISACVKIEKQINEDEAYRLVINKIKQMLTNNQQ